MNIGTSAGGHGSCEWAWGKE